MEIDALIVDLMSERGMVPDGHQAGLEFDGYGRFFTKPDGQHKYAWFGVSGLELLKNGGADLDHFLSSRADEVAEAYEDLKGR